MGIRSCVFTERSVAVDASGRRGKVISDIIDAREVCLGCGVKLCEENTTAGLWLFDRSLASKIQSPSPESYRYNSLIFSA